MTTAQTTVMKKTVVSVEISEEIRTKHGPVTVKETCDDERVMQM